MDEVLKRYQLINCAREITALIGKRTHMWAVLQEAYPHLIRAYGNRTIYLKTDWEQDQILIAVDVAYPPQELTKCFKSFSRAYYDGVPEKVKKLFVIDKL